jgi:hypothetical protein
VIHIAVGIRRRQGVVEAPPSFTIMYVGHLAPIRLLQFRGAATGNDPGDLIQKRIILVCYSFGL